MCFNCLNCESLVSVCSQSLVGERQHIVPDLLGNRRDLGKVICLDVGVFFFPFLSALYMASLQLAISPSQL